MKRYDYYLHRSGGRAFDYFNHIGEPFRVSVVRFYLFKLFGYRATRVRRWAPLWRVMLRATLKKGARRHSLAVQDVRRQWGWWGMGDVPR